MHPVESEDLRGNQVTLPVLGRVIRALSWADGSGS